MDIILVKDFPISIRVKNALEKSGIKSSDDFRNKTLEDLKCIDGIGARSILELREYLYSKFNIVLKPKVKASKIKNANQCKSIILKFLGHSKNIEWGKEMKNASKLLEYYPFEVMMSITLYFKISSLAFFFTDQGKKTIKKFLPTISLTKQSVKQQEESFPLEEVELEINDRKPISIRDFMKL